METAIKIAIENGWKWKNCETTNALAYEDTPDSTWIYFTYRGIKDHNLVNNQVILLDRLFWQALGKGLGWDMNPEYCTSGCGCPYPNGDGSHEFECVWKPNGNSYLNHWHSFIDHLAEGKDMESFFTELLATKK